MSQRGWKALGHWIYWGAAYVLVLMITVTVIAINVPLANTLLAKVAFVASAILIAAGVTAWWRYQIVNKEQIILRRTEREQADARKLMKSNTTTSSPITSRIANVALGCLGPICVYMLFTDQLNLTHGDLKDIILIIAIPIGGWMLTGFLVVEAIRLKRSLQGKSISILDETRIWQKWNMIGLWLVAAFIALIAGLWLLSGIYNSLSGMSGSTLLIAGLLFMILLALWQISHQLNQRR